MPESAPEVEITDAMLKAGEAIIADALFEEHGLTPMDSREVTRRVYIAMRRLESESQRRVHRKRRAA
jgi:hypothetical protein